MGMVKLKPKNQKLWYFATRGMPASSGGTQSTKRSGSSAEPILLQGLGYVDIFCHQRQMCQMGGGLYAIQGHHLWLCMYEDFTDHYSVTRNNTDNVTTDKCVQHLAIEHTLSAPPYSQSTAISTLLTCFRMIITGKWLVACGLAFVGHVTLESRIIQREEVSEKSFKTIKEQRLWSSRWCWREHQ